MYEYGHILAAEGEARSVRNVYLFIIKYEACSRDRARNGNKCGTNIKLTLPLAIFLLFRILFVSIRNDLQTNVCTHESAERFGCAVACVPTVYTFISWVNCICMSAGVWAMNMSFIYLNLSRARSLFHTSTLSLVSSVYMQVEQHLWIACVCVIEHKCVRNKHE